MIAMLATAAASGAGEPAAQPSPAPIKCLRTDHVGTVEPLDANLVLLHGTVGRTYWISRLRQACTGLRPTSKVLFGSGTFGTEI
jgi:hypothetical protein